MAEPLRPSATLPTVQSGPTPPTRPFRDNTRLIVAGIVALLVLLAGLLTLARSSSRLAPLRDAFSRRIRSTPHERFTAVGRVAASVSHTVYYSIV